MDLASVVVLRSGHHGGLGVVRSLGRLGIPVYTLDANWWEPAFSSRYCRGRFYLDTGALPTGESIGKLLLIGRRIGNQPLLIPTTDTTAIWVAENADALQEAFRFPRQDPELLRLLCDKFRMQELARRNGIPTAQSMVPRSTEEVEQFLETAAFPVIAKATNAEHFRRDTGGTKFILHSPSELLDLYSNVADREDPGFMIQEFIPGEDWMFDGYFDANSECLFGICGKKIRRFPPDTGVTSLGICTYNETVAETTARFMKAIGYHGILDIGFRYDRRMGQYKVLDVNPRIGCTFRLFTSTAGADVARVLYWNLTGQPVPPFQAAEGRKWIVEDFELIASIHALRNGSLKVGEWLRSFRGVQEAACFAWDDPLPAFLMPLADFGELLKWSRCRIRRRRTSTQNQTSSSSVSIS